MLLTCPPYMGMSDATRVTLRYVWDDTRASRDFRYDAGWVLEAADALSLRAQLVLCVGLYEWVAWRFDGLHARTAPLLFNQAAWCATVDGRYLRFFEFNRSEWMGPVLGPLWCGITWLRPALADGDHDLAEVADGLQYLSRLAMHVAPDAQRLETWLKGSLQRLAAMFPAQEEDPFEDLFDEGARQRRGALIGREVLDPIVAYNAARGRDSMAFLLAEAESAANPFLATPQELQHAGFAAVPYKI